MWILLAVLTGILYGTARYLEGINGYNDGEQLSRQTRIGFWGSGNFLHGSIFEGNPLVEAFAKVCAPFWRSGVYDEIPPGFPGSEAQYDADFGKEFGDMYIADLFTPKDQQI